VPLGLQLLPPPPLPQHKGRSVVLFDEMTTRRFAFRYPEWREIDAALWVTWWAGRYNDGDNPQYFDLIAKQGKLSAEDFEQIGKWKERCLKPGNDRWKTGTPTAYDVWMQAKAQLPKCPDMTGITAFLTDWSERTFSAAGKDQRRQRFGLSRATTLLHFLSGGEYPILDSRVVTAMIRLGSPNRRCRNHPRISEFFLPAVLRSRRCLRRVRRKWISDAGQCSIQVRRGNIFSEFSLTSAAACAL
jgi:hypothetical protein